MESQEAYAQLVFDLDQFGFGKDLAFYNKIDRILDAAWQAKNLALFKASDLQCVKINTTQRTTITGNLFYQLFFVIFFILGGHRIFIESYFMSFQWIPLDKLALSGSQGLAFFDLMVRLTADMLMLAVILSAPIAATTFLTDLVFGILNRVAPQLNAYFMSMPIKAISGIMILLIAMGPILDRFEVYAEWALNAAYDTLRLLGGGS